VCATKGALFDGTPAVVSYIPNHNPFQFYQSTANPHHLPATSPTMIGQTDQANHQYDISDFFAALNAGILPAVSILKAPAYQDGHPLYSNPLDEQTFLVNTINALETSPFWDSTAVIIAYDDSDGWYDHVMPPIVNGSSSPLDALSGSGACGNNVDPTAPMGRCGYGRPRSFNSSKTTGTWDGSAARHSTLWLVHSSTRSNSRTVAMPESFCSIRPPACRNKTEGFTPDA
jgi:hypothetical protein